MKRYFPSSQCFSALLWLTAVGCTNSTKDTATLSALESVPQARSNTDLYAVSNSESTMVFTGFKTGGSHQGTFAIKEGIIAVEEGEVYKGRIIFDLNRMLLLDLPADSEDYVQLHQHLRSDQLFHIDSFPVATFELTRIKKLTRHVLDSLAAKSTIASHRLNGNLTLKDSTHNIGFYALMQVNDSTLESRASFAINRRLWGVEYSREKGFVNKVKDNAIKDMVDIEFKLKAFH